MKYFDQDFINFFKELAANNHKDWFHANKKRYEKSVKDPFYKFLNDLIQEIKKDDSGFDIAPKDCVLRINRDIRFSKDKTPYNLHYSAVVSRVGRKDKSVPGIFLRFSPEMVGIMGGCYVLSKEQLEKIRHAIVKDPKAFRKVIENTAFVNKFKNIRGDVNKRIPKEFQNALEKEPLLANKQFYFVAEKKPEFILSENLLEDMMSYYHAAKPVNHYFIKNM